MKYPNIHFIDANVNFYVCKDEQKPQNTNHYGFIKKAIASQTQDNQSVIIFSNIHKDTKYIINYLKENTYDKIHFVIDDVFRVSMSPFSYRTAQNYEELHIINNIIESACIEKFAVYHCENLKNHLPVIQNYYNQIGYLDLFLYEMAKNFRSLSGFRPNTRFNNKITCLNNRFDWHRYYLSTFLLGHKESIVTFNDYMPAEKFMSQQSVNLPINKFSENYQKIINSNLILMDKKFSKEEILDPKCQHSLQPFNIIRSGFVNLIGETTFFGSHAYISEKSLKPMVVYRPFIMAGPKGNLEHLKDLGFKTFDKWWSEDYDNIYDPHSRLEAIFNLCLHIFSKTNEELIDMYHEMTPVLIHNANHIKEIPKYMIEQFDWSI